MTIFRRLAAMMQRADRIGSDFIARNRPPQTYAEIMRLHGHMSGFFAGQSQWHEPDKCDAIAQQVVDLARVVNHQPEHLSPIARKVINRNIIGWSKYLSSRDERALAAIINPPKSKWWQLSLARIGWTA